MPSMQRPLRICGASGSASDRRHTFGDMINATDDIDVVVGDWMSEGNMPAAAHRKAGGTPGYEASFLEVLEPAIAKIAEKGLKLAVNAGASDTELLYKAVKALIDKQKLPLKLAWVSGDEVIDQVQRQVTDGSMLLASLDTGAPLQEWIHKPFYAQAYLGAFGVAKAFEEGADIVICGRVADASVCMGAAIWWHDWTRKDLPELAASLIAGHLIECSTYVTGANFSGFKHVPDSLDPGLPIAEIGSKGEILITKLKGTGGCVTVSTVTAQLLYEIQGPWYFNSDVTAQIDKIKIEQAGDSQVRVSNIIGLPPPPTTKVGISALAGYQGELHWALVGLDIEEKSALLEKQIRLSLGETRLARLSVLKFTTYGGVRDNPRSQDSATVDFKVFAQAPTQEAFAVENFIRPVWDIIMCSYPGATPHAAITSAIPRPWFEYWVTLLPQSLLDHQVHLSDGRSITIPPPTTVRTYPAQQPSSDPEHVSDLASFGDTIDGPLGWIVHARSGDKGCNANVGFFVRQADEWAWLRSLLTISKMEELLGDEYKGKKIDRFELPSIWAVHFLCHEHLDRGINSSSTYDILGKNLAEFLRARWVPIPTRFLLRGKI